MRSVIQLSASGASLMGEYPFLYDGSSDGRHLQFEIPDYTSPPTDAALAATPEAYRDDAVIDAGRDAAGNGTCSDDVTLCQIPFAPSLSSIDVQVGVVFYGGGLVDPRSYSPIANTLASRYGIAVALQIFQNDLAFTTCDSGRVQYASELFPSVERWVLAGHSLGGVAAMADVWSFLNDTSSKVGGLALLGSYVRQDLGCGLVDFSDTQIPMACVNATEDLILNVTNYLDGLALLPPNDTFLMAIHEGNHAQFGSYDGSQRYDVLGQVDGNASIPESVQLDLSIASIAHVASRMGFPLSDNVKQGGEAAITSSANRLLRPFEGFLFAVSLSSLFPMVLNLC